MSLLARVRLGIAMRDCAPEAASPGTAVLGLETPESATLETSGMTMPIRWKLACLETTIPEVALPVLGMPEKVVLGRSANVKLCSVPLR
jgi:hypothetical protein